MSVFIPQWWMGGTYTLTLQIKFLLHCSNDLHFAMAMKFKTDHSYKQDEFK